MDTFNLLLRNFAQSQCICCGFYFISNRQEYIIFLFKIIKQRNKHSINCAKNKTLTNKICIKINMSIVPSVRLVYLFQRILFDNSPFSVDKHIFNTK